MGEGAISGRSRRFAALLLSLLVAATTLSACGDDDSGGPVELSWFIFNEPSGVLPTIAKRCSEQSTQRRGAPREEFTGSELCFSVTRVLL